MSASWPYDEARRIRHSGTGPVVFETGYGPSGLPHIGTFTEVLRTTWVQRAFEEITGLPTRLICFSDDLDGMRKVPENVPNRELLEPHVGRSLTRVPDPFGSHDSFAHHNNARLCEFLDRFGFEYEFVSATEAYRSGRFDETLLRILNNYDEVCDIILPTLGEDRRATYCPFMPILADGRVLHDGFTDYNPEAGTVIFEVDGEYRDFPVTGGNCKLQWKVDWAMRWMALGVDYEMAGKDLIDSVTLSSKIVRALGEQPPTNFIYEMFLDEEGRKIAKSIGNGLTIDEWLRYGPQESLAFYLYREPKKAKKLYASLVPRAIDEYWQARERYAGQSPEQQQGNPVHHVHRGQVPTRTLPVTFGLLVNLIGILGEPDEEQVWGYVLNHYASEANEDVRALIPYALTYHREQLASLDKTRREPTDEERSALRRLAVRLDCLSIEATAEEIQAEVYEVGKEMGYADNLREWFKVIYETVFGSSEGPRLGAFIKVYGVGAFAIVLGNIAGDYSSQPLSVTLVN